MSNTLIYMMYTMLRIQGKYKLFVWLLAIRLGFNGLHSLRLLLQIAIKYIRRQRQLSLSSSPIIQPDTTNNSLINSNNSINNTNNNSGSGDNNAGTSIEQEDWCKAEDEDEEVEKEVEEEYVLEGYQCILCRGNIYKPTCTPCGHLYCWECLISLISSSSTLKLKPPIPTTNTTLTTLATISSHNNADVGSNNSGGGGTEKASFGPAGSKDGYFYVKCPSCRHVFLPQQIRTLYHFQQYYYMQCYVYYIVVN